MKKRYSVDDLNEKFHDIYNEIIKPSLTPEEIQEKIDSLYYEDEDIENEDSLLTIYRSDKLQLKGMLSYAIECLKGEYSDDFSIEVGRLGGKLGGLKRKFIQNCKIFVIHKLFPNHNFSGNMIIRISETLFGKGINKSFLCDCGYNLGSDALFNGKSDIPEINNEMIEQSMILITLLKKVS